MSLPRFKRSLTVALLVSPLWLQAGPAVDPERGVAEPRASAVTTNRVIAPQARRTFPFKHQGVFFSTDFDGGRLASIEASGPGQFQASVQAENYPANDSPWYSFKIWATSNQTVQIKLTYKGAAHRYSPKISSDRIHWTAATGVQCNTNHGNVATFTLAIGPNPQYVAGQELFTSVDYAKWLKNLSRSKYVKTGVLGKSSLGKPIRTLEITETKGPADHVILLGRQHPPETTGAIALREVVETLCGNSGLARAFRQRFKTTVIPVMNPDGVDAGHWRHNAKGADINRDWGQFNQAETKLVRKALEKITAKGETIRFALDFHSTGSDVFYIAHPAADDDLNDPSWAWLQGMRQNMAALSGTNSSRAIPNAEHSLSSPDKRTLAFTPWASKQYGIAAATYEVGDNTDHGWIRELARASARSMMSTLIKRDDIAKLPADQRPRRAIKVALYKGPGTAGKGPPNIMRYFDAATNVIVSELSPVDIRSGLLRKFDLVIFAGGSASKQAETIGEKGRHEVREFVQGGGGYLGICAGSYLATSGYSWGLNLVDAKTISPKWQRGVGNVKIELTSLGRQSLRDLPGPVSVLYANGPIVQPNASPDLDDYEVLAWFRTELAQNGSPAGIMVDSPAILRGTLGKGRVICFAPHPEQTPGLEDLIEAGIKWAAKQSN